MDRSPAAAADAVGPVAPRGAARVLRVPLDATRRAGVGCPGVAAVVAGALLVLAGVLGDAWPVVASVLVGGVAALAVLARPRLAELVLEVRLPRRPVAGSPTPVVLQVSGDGRGTTALEVVLLGAPPAALVVPPVGGAPQPVEVAVVPARRGVLDGVEVEVRARDALGLSTVRRRVRVPARVVVHPAVVDVPALPGRCGPGEAGGVSPCAVVVDVPGAGPAAEEVVAVAAALVRCAAQAQRRVALLLPSGVGTGVVSPAPLAAHLDALAVLVPAPQGPAALAHASARARAWGGPGGLVLLVRHDGTRVRVETASALR